VSLLEAENLTVAYGHIEAVKGITFTVEEGEMVAILGANGAGKTTTLRAISGLLPLAAGQVRFQGEVISGMPADRIVAMGMAHVPEGRRIFANLTVLENLLLATYHRKDRRQVQDDLERVFSLFPRLAERRDQYGGTLSGGEQQMLAVGRALMTRGRLILLDEPSMGLAPILVRDIFRILQEINRAGTTVLLVEQNAHQALQVAHRGYVLENGRLVMAGPAQELAGNPRVREAYLGG